MDPRFDLPDDDIRVASPPSDEVGTTRSPSTVSPPHRWDWRDVGGASYVGPVLNQGACAAGLCFDTCATIEASIRVKRHDPELDVDLSEGFLLFCGGGDCSNGLGGLEAGLQVALATGIVDEACMPFEPPAMDCASARCADWESRLTKLLSYTAHTSMAARKQAIVSSGPVLGAMVVYSDLLSYTGGVYTKSAAASYSGATSVCVVGYDDGDGCWIVKKSWSAAWGEGGFCRIAYAQPDLKIDTDWPFFSVDPDVPPWRGNGPAKHLVVDDVMASASRLWAFAGEEWRSRQITDSDFRGLVRRCFEADAVHVWWEGPEITHIRSNRSPSGS